MANDDVKKELAKTATALVPTSGTEIRPTAAAAQVKALVEARCVMALNRPRVLEQVRQDLLKECSRPSFALEDVKGKGNSALYRRPIGGGSAVEGLGIRFAEVALRCYGNVMADSFAIQETAESIEKYCFVLDIETNISWGDTVRVAKTVERKKLKEGQTAIKSRRNSSGEIVYVVEADEDALITKEAALVSKKMRTLTLRLIPGDLQDQCIEMIKATREKDVVDDPDAAMRRVADGMALQNVTVVMLEEFLDHPIAQCTPAEIVNLQSLYGALRDGDSTWAEIMENAEELRKTKKSESKKPAKGNEAAREKVAEQQKTTPTKTAAPKKPTPEVVDVCLSCGATEVELDGNNLCPECRPKPKKAVEPAKTAPAKKTLPWEKKKTTPVAEETTQPELSLEGQVAEMAKEKKPTPIVAKKAPKHPEVKGQKMPAYVNVISEDEVVTDEQHERLRAAMGSLAGYDTEEKVTEGLANTIKAFSGVPLEELNTHSAEILISVIENWE